jgi:hypothetical protein
MSISSRLHGVQERRRQVSALYMRHHSQAEIAQAVGVTQAQVSYDLKALHAAWLKDGLQNYDARKAIELQRIDALERVAWEAWERSLQPREVTLTEATEGGEGAPRRKASMRKEGQAGDPRFLEQVHKCIVRRCALLGLDAPQKIAPTSPDGETPWEGMVVYLPSKAPSPEEWNQAVAQLIPLAQQEQN